MTTTIEVRAPSEQSEGTRSQVQRWLKNIGETVAENEPLIEVETDKVTIEIPAPAGGVLREILKHEQEEIEPGELLGTIQSAADSASPSDDSAASADSADSAPAAAAGSRPPAPGAEVRMAAFAAHAEALSTGRSSPAVRRLIAEHGLESAPIRGTGAGGRVTVDDVLAYVAAQRSASQRQERPMPTEAEAAVAGRKVPHSTMRKRIAERMVESLLHTAPHVTTVFEANMSAVMAHRAAHKEEFQRQGVSLTFTAYFLAACVDAIREVPEANSRWTEDALIVPDTVNIGVATALEGEGLVVPVVRNVQGLDLFGIARELGEVVERARLDKLTPNDVRDGTFTISNHGVSGSLVATPIIINQPQSAILGVGKLEKRAVVVTESGEDRIVIQPRCFITLTLDHRVMDGHRANRFLQVLVDRLESWS
ncbi:2-oxo acid dehydrogenase subunit E2 [Steroidobacter sp. S1-65]|uniref:Dihydrolipoamide acetyltransferase component of pyruvate dehydrogenase complex n=1 Tax=Steroidobacter gossypii TaxID=2805490 RepID=A0ABS1WWI0_9GAMM|nr:dihydrolipoamide acetyltransferase family protein [Steroidobacter gossypii]MBM0105339.1 2-oxo acid dehydrogenase subunit E2 [Steroidobacter gossypii]